MTTSAAQPAPTGHPAYSATFPAEERSAARARAMARDVFGTWALDDLGEAAGLVLSELFTNAVRHARTPAIRVRIDRYPTGWVRVGVIDRDPRCLPEVRHADSADESGRGLFLVDVLSTRWGYDLMGSGRRPWGKRVWAEWRTGTAL